MKFIYLLRDPMTRRVRYVGQTGSMRVRLKGHLESAKRHDRHTERGKWIASLLEAGHAPIIEEIERVRNAAAGSRERFWIGEYLRRGENLLNVVQRSPASSPAISAEEARDDGPAHERKPVYASLPWAVYERLLAFGEREQARSGLEPRDGTLLTMLARKGLDVVEAEVGS